MADQAAAAVGVISPRINGSRLGEFKGQIVRFVGKVEKFEKFDEEQLSDEEQNKKFVGVAELEAPDGSIVECKFTEEPTSIFVEVVATVKAEGVLEQRGLLWNLGENLSLQQVNHAINLSSVSTLSFLSLNPTTTTTASSS